MLLQQEIGVKISKGNQLNVESLKLLTDWHLLQLYPI